MTANFTQNTVGAEIGDVHLEVWLDTTHENKSLCHMKRRERLQLTNMTDCYHMPLIPIIELALYYCPLATSGQNWLWPQLKWSSFELISLFFFSFPLHCITDKIMYSHILGFQPGSVRGQVYTLQPFCGINSILSFIVVLKTLSEQLYMQTQRFVLLRMLG